MKISNEELYSLVKKISELNASEITVKNEDLVIKIKHGANTQEKKAVFNSGITDQETVQSNANAEVKTVSGKSISAPINGTFYSAPGPDEPPYIKTGDKVKKGEPVCILEAMKMMNTINMPEDGVILSIEASNEDIVDSGQALVIYDAV